MKKAILILCGLIILSMISLYCSNYGFNELNKSEDKMKANLGKKIILEKDTLSIVDYSMFNNNYTLSNGKTISSHIVENFKLKK